MAELLMPKATAVWLVENTALTFDQIAAFCGLHRLEVQGIADGEVAVGILGLDPVANGQVSRDEIVRCEQDPSARLEMAVQAAKVPQRARRARYTPVSKRQDRPNAISWLLKNYEELSDAQIGKLLGTTKATINAVRERTHWNTPNISPQDPILLGICTETELLEAVTKARQRAERAAKRAERAERKAHAERAAAAEAAQAAGIAAQAAAAAAAQSPGTAAAATDSAPAAEAAQTAAVRERELASAGPSASPEFASVFSPQISVDSEASAAAKLAIERAVYRLMDALGYEGDAVDYESDAVDHLQQQSDHLPGSGER